MGRGQQLQQHDAKRVIRSSRKKSLIIFERNGILLCQAKRGFARKRAEAGQAAHTAKQGSLRQQASAAGNRLSLFLFFSLKTW
jgi:hypothetical protein